MRRWDLSPSRKASSIVITYEPLTIDLDRYSSTGHLHKGKIGEHPGPVIDPESTCLRINNETTTIIAINGAYVPNFTANGSN